MARQTIHTHYRGWDLVVTRVCPCLGSAGRRRPPFEIITARGPDRQQVRSELRIGSMPSRPSWPAILPELRRGGTTNRMINDAIRRPRRGGR